MRIGSFQKSMKIGLIDVDSHNSPNLALMKLSGYHKAHGDHVELADINREYDRIYVSKIFTESREPELPKSKEIKRGGSGYDLVNKLDDRIEHCMPDYSLYPEYKFALGMLTRGCPRVNHGFCITPKKDGCISQKVADLSEFWQGQKDIVLLDQNILACKDRLELLQQLIDSGATVEFNGGMDARYMTPEIIEMVRKIKVKDYHFAWDDPREDLLQRFTDIKNSAIKNPNQIGVYVLTNYWSSITADLYRVYCLRNMGFMPFIMIYNKQKFVDSRGRWLPGVYLKYATSQLQHFKTCQHMQRWAGNRKIIKSCPDFNNYEPYRKWVEKGKPVPSLN